MYLIHCLPPNVFHFSLSRLCRDAPIPIFKPGCTYPGIQTGMFPPQPIGWDFQVRLKLPGEGDWGIRNWGLARNARVLEHVARSRNTHQCLLSQTCSPDKKAGGPKPTHLLLNYLRKPSLGKMDL